MINNILHNLIKKLRTNRKKSTAVGLLIILFLVFTVSVFLNLPDKVKAAWYDDAYLYRQKINFTHDANITSERRITLSLDTAELIAAGVMQADCDDTRFTDINGLVLRFQLTGTCDNAATTYDFVVPQVFADANVAYVYYGSPSAVNASQDVSGVTALTPSGGAPAITNRTAEEKGSGPALYWKFDETQGSAVNDSSYGQNSGVVTTAIDPMTEVEQQINIIDQEYPTTGTTDAPTDNSLGLIYWDGTKYDDETVYFEAVIKCTTCTGGNTAAMATLYTDAGSAVTGGSVSTTSSSYTRVRSSAITGNLTNGEEYTIRIKVDATSGTAAVKAARLIIVQSGTTITDTVSQVEIGNAQTITDTSYGELTDPKYFYYDSSKYSGTATNYFEATIQGEGSTQGNGRLWSSGLELGDDAGTYENEAGMDAALSVQSSVARSGTYSLQRTANGNRQSMGQAVAGTDNDGPFYIRVYMRVGTYPGAENPFFSLNNNSITSAEDIWMTINGSGQITLYDEDGQIGSASSALSTDTWYRIELEYNRTAAAGSHIVRARIDGTEFAGAANRDFAAGVRIIRIGGNIASNGEATGVWYFDDIAVNNSTGGYPGPGRIIHLRPNAAGDNTQWTRGGSDSGANWSQVEETTPNDATDYVESNTSGQIDDYNLDDTPGGIGATDRINLVGVGMRHTLSSNTSTDPDAVLRIKASSSGTVEETGNLGLNSGSWFTHSLFQPRFYRLTLYDLPGASTTSWTKSDLDSAQIGFRQTASDTDSFRFSSIWLLVDYTPVDEIGVQAQVKLQECDEASCSWSDVSGSTVTNVSSSFARVRSSAISLTHDRRYRIAVARSSASGTIKIANAKIIMEQTNASGLTKTQILQQQVNTLATDADSTYTSQGFPNNFDDDNLGTVATTYYEATLKTSAGTGYAQAYNDTAAAAVSSSEVSTTSTSYTRVRSGSLTMPTSASDIDTQIKNASTDTTSVGSSWLVTNLQGPVGDDTAYWKTADLCKNGGCASFASQAAYRTYSADTELAPGTGSFTVSGWFRHSSTVAGTDVLVGRSNGGGYKVYTSSSGFCFGIDSDGSSFPSDSACTTTTYADSTWHHFSAVKNGTSSISLYIDGQRVAVDSSITSSSISGSSPDFVVGDDVAAGSNPWDGYIDEIKYYNYARSEAEIRANFAGPGTAKGASVAIGSKDSLSSGLTGYWKMDESSWTVDCTTDSVLDSSGNDKHGDACPNSTGPAGGAVGKFGRAGSFDGNNDYVNMGNPSIYDISLPFSMFAWINVDTLPSVKGTESTILSRYSDVTNSQYLFAIGTDNILYFFKRGVSAGEYTFNTGYTFTASDTNVWRHVGVTGSADGVYRMYVDGRLVDTGSATDPTFKTNQADFHIGAINNGTRIFQGEIDEVRMYNRSLSPSDVSSLYNFAPGPVGYWNFDENTGSNAYDTSTNGNTGVLTAGPTWEPGKFGSAVGFNGSGAYVSVADPASGILDFTDGTDFTLSGWFKTNAIGTSQTIAAKKTGNGLGAVGYLVLLSAGGKLNAYVSSNGASQFFRPSSSTLSANTWYHFAFVFDEDSEANSTFWLNGVIDSGTATGTIGDVGDISNTQILAIGTESDLDTPFNGLIDDIKIYNYTRSSRQIIEDLNGGHPAGGSPVGSQVAYWKFDEAQGTTANNTISTQSSLTGAVSGTTWRIPGTQLCKINGCLDFDGSDDVTTVTNATAIDIDTNLANFTISNWFNADSDGEGDVGQLFNKTTNNYLRVDSQSGTSLDIEANLDRATTDANINIASATTTGTWTHVALSWDGTTLKLYINGNLRGTSTGSGSVTADTGDLLIGGATTANFDGKIDEFKIYSSALSDDEIKIDYNAGSAITLGGVLGTQDNEGFGGNGPVGWWKMDENTDNTCAGGTNDVCDSSGNGSNLAFASGPVWVPGKIGSGVSFDGTDDILEGTTASSVNSLTTMTVTAWFYEESTGGGGFGRILRKGDNATPTASDSYFDLNAGPTNDLQWRAGYATTGVWISTCDGATLNQWHHVAVVYTHNDVNQDPVFYYDGVLCTVSETTTPVGATNSDSTTVAIGDWGDGTRAWDGTIDNVKIFDYHLTQAQIAYDYNRGAPLLQYKFDECQGLTANNAAPNAAGTDPSVDGTITPGASGNTTAGTCDSGTSTEMWDDGTDGKRNASLGFDGTDDYVIASDSFDEVVTPTDAQFSLTAWINPTTLGTGDVIIGKYGDSGCSAAEDQRAWLLYFTDTDKLTMLVNESLDGTGAEPLIASNASVATGTWTHVAAVTDIGADTISLYINGKLDRTEVFSSAVTDISNSTNPIIVGARCDLGDIGHFDGLMDDVRFYGYSLTGNQIKQIMNNGAVFFGPAEGSP